MTKKISLFNLFGFEVRLHGSWIFLALLVAWSLAMGYFPSVLGGLPKYQYWLMGLVGVIGLFFSIVFHEFFHSVVARHYKMPMKGITLFIFGGIAEMGEEPLSPKTEGLMAIAGPVASLVLWLVFGLIAEGGQSAGWPLWINMVVLYLSQINLILAVFNMVPAFPMDGGRVLRSVLWSYSGNLRWATHWATRMGAVFGMILVVLGVIGLFVGAGFAGIWYIFLGVFIGFLARSSYVQVVSKETLKDESIQRFVEPLTESLDPAMTVQIALNDYFYKYRQRLFPVISEGRLLGCVSVKQISGLDSESRQEVLVQEIMQPCDETKTVRPSDSAWEAFRKMAGSNVSELLVVEDRKVFGKIRRRDLLEFLNLKLEVEEGRPAYI